LVCFSHQKGWRECDSNEHSPIPYFDYPFPSPAPLPRLSPSSDAPQCIPCSSHQVSFPGALHRVLSITERLLTTTTPPPSLPHAGILASLFGSSGVRVPSFQQKMC